MRTSSPSKPSPFRHTPLAAAIACVLTAHGAMAACVPGSGTYCVTNTAPNGANSLQQAVLDASNGCATFPNPVVKFDIATGPFVIQPSSPLVAFCTTGPIAMLIDGTTQPGWTANTSTSGFNGTNPIVVDGSGMFSFAGIFTQDYGYGASLDVRGLEIRNFNYGGFATALQGNLRVFGNLIHNNYLPLDVDGPGQANPAKVGTTAPADRNVIYNNTSVGIRVSYGGFVSILGNVIGVDPSGTAAAPNMKGIELQAFDGVTVAGNVISGNQLDGIAVSRYPYITNLQPPSITGNKIGRSAGGTPIPNGGNGIYISAVTNATIQNNVIANNGGHGITLVNGLGSTSGVNITQNSIHSNSGKNIDLDFYGGPLPNDSLDTDTGPNTRQNHPDISLVTQSGGNTSVSWSLNSEAGKTYRLEFYSNAVSGVPAGTQFIQFVVPPSTDAGGNVSAVTVIPGTFNNISTLAINAATLDTSEFSPAVALTPTPEVTVSPNPLTFSNTVVGTSAGPNPITVSSIGTGSYQISTFDSAPSCYGGPICSSGAFICSNGCSTGTPYAPSSSCAINVTFSPSVVGPATQTFYICDNAPGSPRAVTLNGNAVAPPPSTISPGSFDFGSVAVGGFSAPQTFTVNNPAPTSVSLSSFTITGPFQVVANTCGSTLAASSSCGLDARFAPTVAGGASGTLTTVAGSATLTANLSGTAAPPPPTTIAPISFNFGTVLVGTTSSPGTFTINNPALVSVTLGPITVTPPFQLAGTTCTSSLSPGASCTANATFNPPSPGPFTGTISGTANAGTFSAGLTGTGGAPPPTVTITPSSVDYGPVPVGTVGTPQLFTINNPASVAVTLGTLSTTGPYVILSTTCTSSLAASASCGANVKFAPTAVGPQPGTFVVPASTGTVSATLNGTGLAAALLSVSPPAYDFGSLQVGATSGTKTFTVSNPSTVSTSFSGPTVSGPFQVASTTCTGSLPPSGNCDANVRFAPTGSGSASGLLSVTSPAGTSSAALMGAGLLQAALVMPTGTIELGTVTLGSAPVQRVITLRNTGNAALTIERIQIGLPFTLTSTCPINLLPGESCNVAIEHDPTALGDFTGSLVVVTNATGGSRTVPVHVSVQALPEPVIRVSPQSIGFGDRMAGISSPAQRITIVNTGGANAVGLSLRFNTPHFAIQNTDCGAVLAAQASCFADVVFAPQGFGPKRDTFSVRSNAANGPHTVSVSGAGCRPIAITQSRGGISLNCAP